MNFPEVSLPTRPSGTRFIHVHDNIPGVLALVNDVFRAHRLNIGAQYLQTDPRIGYVVVEADDVEEPERVLAELRAIPGTIRARLLYDRG